MRLDISDLEDHIADLNYQFYRLKLNLRSTAYDPVFEDHLVAMRNFAGDIAAETTRLLKVLESTPSPPPSPRDQAPR